LRCQRLREREREEDYDRHSDSKAFHSNVAEMKYQEAINACQTSVKCPTLPGYNTAK